MLAASSTPLLAVSSTPPRSGAGTSSRFGKDMLRSRPLWIRVSTDGAAVALLGLFESPISGASMNPARTLGPDIDGVNFT